MLYTVNNYIDNVYLPDISKTVRANTLQGYESAIKCHIRPKFGLRIINKITHREIQEWVSNFEKAGAAEKAFKTLRQIIKHYINYTRDFDMDDPTKGVKLPKKEEKPIEILTQKEQKIFIRGIKGHPVEAVALINLDLGLRKSEGFGLCWQDIDLKTRIVRITKTRHKIDGQILIYPPKTNFSKRKVKLSRRAAWRLFWIKLKIKPSPQDHICLLDPDEGAKQLKAYAKEKGLPWCPMKNFRHCFATRAVEKKVPLYVLGRWLGHTNINMAYNRYVRMSDGNLDTMAKQLGR